MLYMVVENFRNGDPAAVGERFQRDGRMLPDGLVYRASWMESSGARCYQLMETEVPELLRVWMKRWDDLVDFEVAQVMPAPDFWALRPPRAAGRTT
jgi:hypothetical protein